MSAVDSIKNFVSSSSTSQRKVMMNNNENNNNRRTKAFSQLFSDVSRAPQLEFDCDGIVQEVRNNKKRSAPDMECNGAPAKKKMRRVVLSNVELLGGDDILDELVEEIFADSSQENLLTYERIAWNAEEEADIDYC